MDFQSSTSTSTSSVFFTRLNAPFVHLLFVAQCNHYPLPGPTATRWLPNIESTSDPSRRPLFLGLSTPFDLEMTDDDAGIAAQANMRRNCAIGWRLSRLIVHLQEQWERSMLLEPSRCWLPNSSQLSSIPPCSTLTAQVLVAGERLLEHRLRHADRDPRSHTHAPLPFSPSAEPGRFLFCGVTKALRRASNPPF